MMLYIVSPRRGRRVAVPPDVLVPVLGPERTEGVGGREGLKAEVPVRGRVLLAVGGREAEAGWAERARVVRV